MPRQSRAAGKAKRQTEMIASPTLPTPPDPDRIEQVLQWVIDGNRDAEILGSIIAQWPDQEPFALVNAAMVRLKESADFQHDVLTGWCFEATRAVYRRMLEMGDLNGALKAIKQMHDLNRSHGKKDDVPVPHSIQPVSDGDKTAASVVRNKSPKGRARG